MSKFIFKNLGPFKWFVLQNFPFIEEDFDAITNWQLFCKLGEEMNKIIDSVNQAGGQVENLTNAFNDLQDYVNNYFDNLDVQEEINNKLDEMAEGGQLSDIIAQYLELQAVLGFNDITDMKNATYIANGSLLRSYGQDTLNDGKGAFYYVRNVQTTDIIDDINVVALHDTNLVAIKCFDYNLEQLQNQLNNTDFILNDECKIFFPYRGQNAGDCAFIQENDKNIVIDIGWEDSVDSLKNWLSSQQINKLDYIIITHYHADHIGGNNGVGLISLLSDSNIDISNLKIYLPHKGINYSMLNSSDKSILEANETAIKNYLTANNIDYIDPDNGDILEIAENCNIKFLNIGNNFYSQYYGNYGNEYNNFSMVCELSHNNRKVLFTGDIYIQAQNLLYQLISQPDVYKAPHHLLEAIANDNYMKKMTGRIMVFQENQDYSGNYLATQLYQNAKNNCANVYDSNYSHNVSIILKNDNIIVNSDNGVFSTNTPNLLTASGIHITNTDLNDLTTPGTYYTLNNTESSTLTNTPLQTVASDTGFITPAYGRCRIIVLGLDVSTTQTMQVFYSASYVFQRLQNNGVWSPWINLKNTNILEETTQLIATGANLNDFYTPGKYQIGNNSVYNSLVNKPESGNGGSVLIVMTTRFATDIRQQFLICASGNIYHRTINMDNYNTQPTSFGSWQKFAKTNV